MHERGDHMNDHFRNQQTILNDRQQRLQKEAHQAQLAATLARPSRPLYGAALARTGKLMSDVGNHLQTRFGQDSLVTNTASQ
jgi:hypothetical protein